MLTTCPICGYSLDGLPDRHACPECGFEYDKSMTPFDGLQKPGLFPSYVLLLLIALVIPACFVLSWTHPGGLSISMIVLTFVVPPSLVALARWVRPDACPRLILFGDAGLVIVPDRGEPIRFEWPEIHHAKQSWVRGGAVLFGANRRPIVYLSPRVFKSMSLVRQLVDQMNERIDAQRQSEGSPLH